MSSDDGFIASVISALSSALTPLSEATSSTDALATLLEKLGWPDPEGTEIADSLGDVASKVDQLISDIESDVAAVTLVARVAEVFAALAALRDISPNSSLGAPFDSPDFWNALPEDLLGLLVCESLESDAPGFYGVLSFIGVLRRQAIDEDIDSGRAAYIARTVDWSALGRVIGAPDTLMADVYGWGGDFNHAEFLQAVAALGAGLGGTFALLPPLPSLLEPHVAPDNPDRGRMRQLTVLPPVTRGPNLAAFVKPALAVNALPPSGAPSVAPEGLLISPVITGAAQAEIDLEGGAVLTLSGEFQASPIQVGLRPGGITLESSQANLDVAAEIDIAPNHPILLGGTTDGTRFELGSAHLGFSVQGASADLDFIINAGLDEAHIVIDLSQADGFLKGVLGEGPYTFSIPFDLSWSKHSGLQFSGGVGLDILIPVNLVLGGVLSLTEIRVSAGAGETSGTTQLGVGATGSLSVGPLALSFDGIGAEVFARTATLESPGNFGLLDLGLGIKPPDGIGIGVDIGPVSGGGYLFIDNEAGEYGGILSFEVLAVGISAVGLIETRLAEVDGWSMFFALYLDLPSLQLGFGFTLLGVGGVAGVNRGIDVDALGSAVRSGSLDTILFPEDPVADAPIIIDTFRDIFPAADDSYVFGPIVKIGWGTPTLIEAELGIVIQLPDPIVIAVLGSIGSTLPTKEAELVALHLDVAGVIDFEAGTLAIDASLHHSHVVGFALSGDMALRAEFGNAQAFLMSVGGFHPRFDPAGDFPDIRRLSFGISAGSILRVDFQSYFGLTSNSVHFGASFVLDADVAGFGVYGASAFDALVQFSPFIVITSIDFEVSIKAAGIDLMGVMLHASVEGPNRWHVIGTATFEVLGLGKDIRVDELIGPKENEPPAEAPNLLDDLAKLLESDDAWQVIAVDDVAVTLTERNDPNAPRFATPDSIVEVRQTLVPLGIELEKFGNAPIGAHSQFDLQPASGETTTPVNDWFAPGHYFELGKAEKLEGPSFEEMRSGMQFGGGSPVAGENVAVDTGHKAYILDPELPEADTLAPYAALLDARAGISGQVRSASGYTAVQQVLVATANPEYAVVDESGRTVSRTATWSDAYVSRAGRDDLHIERVSVMEAA